MTGVAAMTFWDWMTIIVGTWVSLNVLMAYVAWRNGGE